MSNEELNQQNTEALDEEPTTDEVVTEARAVDSDFLTEVETEPVGEAKAETVPETNGNSDDGNADSEDVVKYQVPEYPKNTTQTHPTAKARLDVDKNDAYPGILLPSHHIGVVEQVIANSTNEELSSVDGRNWAGIASNGRALHPRHAGAKMNAETGIKVFPSAYETTLSDPESNWVQLIESNKGKLGAIKPNFQDSGPVTLTGERAVNRIRSLIGIGDTIKIPLWHSGIWVTLKAPTERELVALWRRLSQDKINLGRMASGAVLSNLNVVLADYLTEFIAAHIESTSYANDKDVLSRILAPDLDHLVWGLACTIYVNGFDYTRAVMGKTSDEKVVVSEKINVSKIQWINRSRLSEFQTAHMTSRAAGSMSPDSVTRYQDEFHKRHSRTVTIEASNGVPIDIDLKIPTLLEYIQVGNEWVGSIVSMVDSVLGMSPDPEERNGEILRQGMSTYLRMYSHWIEKIRVNDVTTVDREAMDGILGDFGQDNKIRDELVTKVREFIDEITTAVIALPALTDAEAVSLPNYPHLVPFNVIQTFFVLLVQRISSLPMEDVE